jgi:hypothetical protein
VYVIFKLRYENNVYIYNFILPINLAFFAGITINQQLLGSKKFLKVSLVVLFDFDDTPYTDQQHLQRYICCVHGDKVEAIKSEVVHWQNIATIKHNPTS